MRSVRMAFLQPWEWMEMLVLPRACVRDSTRSYRCDALEVVPSTILERKGQLR
jgi:hypothetical protein